METLQQFNQFPAKYHQAYERLNERGLIGKALPAYLHYNLKNDRRRYNLPKTAEIAVVLPGDRTEISGMRDIILHLRGNNRLMQINKCHPAYLPLHYVLLFPHCELGWDLEIK